MSQLTMSETKIQKTRMATLADAPAIAEIHAASWRNTYNNVLTGVYLSNIVPAERMEVWNDRLQNPKSDQCVMVAEIDDEVVGFVCVYSRENPEWGSYLDNLHVRSSHQSMGIGKSLLTEAIRWCHEIEPASGMCLLVNQDNLKAQEFYKGLGARNAKEGVWNAPDGSIVPTYWFVWDCLATVVEKS